MRCPLSSYWLVGCCAIGAMAGFLGPDFAQRTARAEPRVEVVSPPSVARGQRQRWTFVGKQLDGPLGVWTSLPSHKLHVRAARSISPERCELDVEVAPDCPLGIYGLRLATESGLSPLHLFAVDDIPLCSALDDPESKFPAAVSRTFRAAEVDRYPVSVKAGQTLSFDVIASRLGTDADPLITIYDPDGRRAFQRDNDPGIFFDCCFEYTFRRDGVYTVEIRDSRHLGAPNWQYVLRIGAFPAVHVALPSALRPGTMTRLQCPELTASSADAFDGCDAFETLLDASQPSGVYFQSLRRPKDQASNWVPVLATTLPSVVEVEPNDVAETASLVPTVPALLHGNLAQPNDRDHFVIGLKKGERVLARAETKTLNSAADVELLAYDATGSEVQRVDDVTLPGGALDEGAITLNADRDGDYLIVVREATGASGPELTYRVELQPVQPRIQVVAEHSAFTIPQEGYQSLPLTITRTDFAGPIELSLVGAPEGVTLDPTTIPESANSLIVRLMAGRSTPLGTSSFSIVARGTLPPVPGNAAAAGAAPAGGAQPAASAGAGRVEAVDRTVETAVVTQPLVDKQFINVDLIKHALRDNQRWLPPSVKTQLALQVTPPSPFRIELSESTVMLPRYLQIPLVIRTTRAADFAGPIAFHAVGGGQFGDESEGRRQLFARFPVAMPSDSQVSATFHSRSQANDATERIDISATGVAGARSITLVRSLTLQVRAAYELQFDEKQITLEPGSSTKLKLNATRLPQFAGPISVIPPTSNGVTMPTSLTVLADQAAVEFEIAVAADAKPRRERLRFSSQAQVGAFQEEPRPTEIDLEIKLPPAAK